ncbi:MAG: HNH endonuclease, partial [Actinobacteria bacterium]|nr:HNH endonuclease [Actinomycetota bacterium]
LFGYFDEAAEEVVQKLHEINAVANAGDIARMRAIVRCDQKRVYRRDDSFDMARWLALELGISCWKAARWLRAGYALDELPVMAAAYERGELSTDKFVELARFVTRDNEEELLAWAKRTSPAGIRARADQELRAPSQETRDSDRWRTLDWEWDESKTRLSLWGSLPADHATRFVKSVERLASKMPTSPEDPADNVEARRADALVAMASASIADDQNADRATVVVHADVDTILESDRNGVLHGGLPLPPEAAALVSCDSRVQTVLHDDDGEIFHVGSPSYVVPKWLRRQVEHRDGYRCPFPNCGSKAFTDVHHIVPWPRGRTELSNLILVCRSHHRLIHIHGWHVKLGKDGMTQWFRPDWTPYSPRPAPEPTTA